VLACRGAAPQAAERRARDTSSSLGFHVLDDDAVRFSETHKLNLVAELPTMVLLETRGLQLSSVKRGGIG
jgi:hypothetical protein